MSTTSSTTDLVQKVTELLNEEKWTRATLNNYTVANFQELDELVKNVHEEGLEPEIRELCEEHLHHTKNSIIALYVSGLLDLARQSVDDANLIHLTQIFSDNHKWGIVEYLANSILKFGENRFALRILADVHNNENEMEKLHEVWERLIRVDYEEADIVRQLAEIREVEDDSEQAVIYYKKALHRYITKKSFANVKDVWSKLVALAPEETEFFYHAEAKIAKVISEERAVQLLELLYPHFKAEGLWDRAIELLKRVLHHDPKNAWARMEITECFRNRHADHSNLDEYIQISNINQNWRPVHEAIADFEKHIAFDTGNFVFHRSWGIGRIRSIEGDQITIDFAKKRGHSMSLKMAVNALEVLPKDHIWVLRAVWKKDKLHTLVKKNIEWALKTVIRSLGNAADMKKIKSELVPAVLTQGEWSSWSTKARKILKENPDFGTLTDRADHFVVRDQPITFEEKTYNKFRAEKDFFDRVKTIEEFLAYVEKEGGDGIDSEFFREMFDFFANFVRSPNQVDEYVVASELVLNKVVGRFPFLKADVELDFSKMYNQIEDLETVFSRLNSSELRKRFLANVRGLDKNWGPVFARLLPYHLSRDILAELEKHGKRDLILAFFTRVYENYREMRETFVWLVRNCADDPWIKEIGVTEEKQLIAMIHIYDITFRDIDNRKDATANRKINRQVQSFLFKDGYLEGFLDRADEDSLVRIFTLISDVKDMDPKVLLDLKQRIIDRFPSFHFYGDDSTPEVSTRKVLYCTAASYKGKQEEYNYLQQVEVPQNSKEIETARAYGDLKENAEYKAAMERQDSLNNRAARLKTELEQARIVKKKDVDPATVAYGTTATLYDINAESTIEYTILGPWESNPSQGIINYQSPFGSRLLRTAKGDTLTFEINETKYNVRIDGIRVADFE